MLYMMNCFFQQAQGCEMSSAIHYLDQQLVMLGMENRALKQRLDSLAEIQKLKHGKMSSTTNKVSH